MQCQKGPFTNKKVREALCYAVDRKTIMDNVYGKTGVPEKLPMPSILWGNDKKIPDYTYDPARAKALLKESGVPLPMKVDFMYLPAWRPYIPNGKRLAEVVQAQLNAVGFKPKSRPSKWGPSGTSWTKARSTWPRTGGPATAIRTTGCSTCSPRASTTTGSG